MKYLIFSLFVMFGFSGCAAIETLGDYVSENKIFTSALARQATARYIAAGEDLDAEYKRAKQVVTRLSRVQEYIDGNPSATVDGLMALVESTIEWDQLDVADRILVQDILALLSDELEGYKQEPGLSANSRIAIKALFDTAISAARVYLMRS
jgi:hypothetical protein